MQVNEYREQILEIESLTKAQLLELVYSNQTELTHKGKVYKGKRVGQLFLVNAR